MLSWAKLYAGFLSKDRKTWKVVVADSYECGSQNWTDGFIEDFNARYGYSPVPYIPVLKGYIVGSRAISDRFLWDLRRMVADKISYDYLGRIEGSKSQTWVENLAGKLRSLGFPRVNSCNMGDNRIRLLANSGVKAIWAILKTVLLRLVPIFMGRKQVSAESFTSGGVAFYRYPARMKQRGDRFFTEGINNTLLHVYIQQPNETVPGVNAWFGNEFNRHNTWFNQIDLFIQYLKRTNFMLQQGTLCS